MILNTARTHTRVAPIEMNVNPYESPGDSTVKVTNERLRNVLHALGLVTAVFAAPAVYAMQSKVPASDFRMTQSRWLAAAVLLTSVSVCVLCFTLIRRCWRHGARWQWLYILAPLGMYTHFVWRFFAG